MNYNIPPVIARRVHKKLNEYLKLISKIQKLENDPDLSFLKDAIPEQEQEKKPNCNPSKPTIKYVLEILSSSFAMDTYEIIDKITKLGWQTTSTKNTYVTVFSILRRESNKSNGLIVKEGSKWKLKE